MMYARVNSDKLLKLKYFNSDEYIHTRTYKSEQHFYLWFRIDTGYHGRRAARNGNVVKVRYVLKHINKVFQIHYHPNGDTETFYGW